MNRQSRRAAERAAKAQAEPRQGPIEAEYVDKMHALAQAIDELFNEQGKPKATGFCLLVFHFAEAGRVNYICNSDRVDMKTLFKEMIARWEGQADIVGTA